MSTSRRRVSGEPRRIFTSSEVIGRAGKRPMKSPSLPISAPSTDILRVFEISMRISESPVSSVRAPKSAAALFSPFFTSAEMSEVRKDLAAASSPRASSRLVLPWALAPQIHTESASRSISANATFLKF